jgi:hypothetical protein
MYYVELIIAAIMSLFKTYSKIKEGKSTKIKRGDGKEVECTTKINDSLLVTGIFDKMIQKIIGGHVTKNGLDNFVKNYVKAVKNETNRHFERVSKAPYTKWHQVGKLHDCQMLRVMQAVVDGTIGALKKADKTLAKRVIRVIDEDGTVTENG